MQEGFGRSEDGNINIIRGSHVFRDTSCRASPGRAGDAELAEGWLVGKRHPTTGAPLRTEELQLARGSVVCCNTHAAHMVSPKAQGSRTRLACSWFFKKRSDATGFTCECKTPARDFKFLTAASVHRCAVCASSGAGAGRGDGAAAARALGGAQQCLGAWPHRRLHAAQLPSRLVRGLRVMFLRCTSR